MPSIASVLDAGRLRCKPRMVLRRRSLHVLRSYQRGLAGLLVAGLLITIIAYLIAASSFYRANDDECYGVSPPSSSVTPDQILETDNGQFGYFPLGGTCGFVGGGARVVTFPAVGWTSTWMFWGGIVVAGACVIPLAIVRELVIRAENATQVPALRR